MDMQRFVRSSFRVAGPLAAVLVSIGLVTAGAQAPAGGQAPGAGPAAAQGPGGGGRGRGGLPPSALRSIAAETTTAKAKNPNWKAPLTPWGHPDLQGVFTTDDMNSVPVSRPKAQMDRESLTPEEFLARASRDEQEKFSAVNVDSFLRNERGTRTFGYTSFVIDPPNGQQPPMRPEYAKARADANRDRGTFGPGPFDDFGDFTNYDRCVTRGILGSTLPVIYGNGLRIVQSPTEVTVTYEMIHDTRVIPLDGRPQLNNVIRQYMGSSRGRWEGETLVVETTNLTGETSIGSNGNGTRHSDQMKLTEWFTRVDPDMIEYRARVEDPVAYTAPFTLRLMFTTQPDYEVYEYSCHEGNGAVGFALSADRAYDRAVAEAKAKGLPIPERHMASPYGPPVEGLELRDINTGETTITTGRGGRGRGGN
jgi:hypothetical protein